MAKQRKKLRDRFSDATPLEKAACCALADLIGMTAEIEPSGDSHDHVFKTITELFDALAAELDISDYAKDVARIRKGN